jgi:hypothetical protein
MANFIGFEKFFRTELDALKIYIKRKNYEIEE